MLPPDVTGFWEAGTAPLSILDEKFFCRTCYFLAEENGGCVAEVDTSITGKNFYSAKILKYDTPIYMLQKIHFPYGAFAERVVFGGMAFAE